jgi:hypothetical protein
VVWIVGAAACVGLVLAFVSRGGRDKPNPNAGGGTNDPSARVALGKPTVEPPVVDLQPTAPIVDQPKRVEPAPPKVEPKTDPPRVEAPPPDRKAAYVRIVAALEGVEAAAIKKYGHKPGPDDKAEFSIPYKAFVNSQTQLVRKKLANDLGVPEAAIDEIKKDGDRAGWAKR